MFEQIKSERGDIIGEPLAYTVIDAARVLGMSRTGVYAAIKAGRLVARKNGFSTLIEREELKRFLTALPCIGAP